jgi:hypothetical protein
VTINDDIKICMFGLVGVLVGSRHRYLQPHCKMDVHGNGVQSYFIHSCIELSSVSRRLSVKHRVTEILVTRCLFMYSEYKVPRSLLS